MRICDGVYLVGSGAIGISHEFDCHVYLIDGGEELALVDAGAGPGVSQVLDNVRAEGLDPGRIGQVLLTHAHPDHAGGAAEFVRLLGCDVVSSEEEARIASAGSEEELGLAMARASGGYSQAYEFRHVKARGIEDGSIVRVGCVEVRPVIVPGHSPGSTCYLANVGGRTCLFSGDSVFINGLVGLMNCPGCSIEDYRRSIGRLSGLGVEALLPGHLLFTVARGQTHVDRAIARFAQIQVPMYIGILG